MQQLPLDLPPPRRALGRAEFTVAPSNAAALALIDASARWPGGKLALTGDAASGKTHLAHVWAADADAVVVDAATLPRLDIPTLAAAAHVVVEDVPAIACDRPAQTALFHLHNMLVGMDGRLLVTGRASPSDWALGLADLQSRLQAATVVRLDPPDDALLAALLIKHFADRQLDVPDGVLRYLVPRMARSGAAAADLARTLDRLSYAEGRRVGLGLARRALDMGGDAGA